MIRLCFRPSLAGRPSKFASECIVRYGPTGSIYIIIYYACYEVIFPDRTYWSDADSVVYTAMASLLSEVICVMIIDYYHDLFQLS